MVDHPSTDPAATDPAATDPAATDPAAVPRAADPPSAAARPAATAVLGTAAAHYTTLVPRSAPHELAGEVRASLTGQRYDSVADVAVCEGGRLLGLVTIEALMAAPAELTMAAIMDDTPPIVSPTVSQEAAAWRMVQHNESSMAVLDEGGRFLGLIPPQRMLAVLLEAHEQDLSRVSGVLHGSVEARRATEEPVTRRLWHRLPWLLIGYLGALLAAVVVGRFEGQIGADPKLAFFLPGVVYLADAVGTQTETVVIRGLSIGVTIRSILRREIATGLLIGVVIGALFVPAGLLLWGELPIALAVGAAVFAACSISTMVAMLLPNVLARGGHDPAFGSGPLATVIQDLLSIVVYFAMVVWAVG